MIITTDSIAIASVINIIECCIHTLCIINAYLAVRSRLRNIPIHSDPPAHDNKKPIFKHFKRFRFPTR